MNPISRRTMLRGLGTAIALPALEAMLPKTAFGAAIAPVAPGPKRLAWLYVPNGVDMSSWKPATVGAGYELTPTLKPLAAFKDRFMVISGLACQKANANGDGPGDHARAQAAYLTGVQPRKSEGANIHLGISADQAAADKIGYMTRFPSLELGLEEGAQAGRCDSGYSCAYLHNLSWRNDTTPVVKDCIPQSVFDRMFGNADPNESAAARALRQERRKSVLDFALSDAKSLQGKVSATDKRKIDEYLNSIREIEIRLTKTASEPEIKPPAGTVRPEAIDLHGNTRKLGVSTSSSLYDKHLPLMLDMMVLAFQTDLTRVITLPFADEESNQTYPWADAPVPHHGTSHHMGDPAKIALLAKINLYHIKHVALMLEKLDKIQEGNGSILDNCLIAYGSGNSDGQRHNHDNLPLLLFGKGGGTVRTGRHIQVDNNTPITNLWLSMLQCAGASWDKLGDSTGKLKLT
jgi:uncharacterized protein DUF1552